MYRISTKRPISTYNNLMEVNRTRLTFLEFCYGTGFITMKEWEQFRGLAMRGVYNG